jgi:chromosome partitioning protein
MFNARTRLGQKVLAEVQENYGLTLIEPPIPRSVRVAEAPGEGVSVLTHARRSRSAEAYRDLATNLVALL